MSKPVFAAIVTGEAIERLEEILQTLRASCKEALEGSWDKTSEGFEVMITACNEALDILEYRCLKF